MVGPACSATPSHWDCSGTTFPKNRKDKVMTLYTTSRSFTLPNTLDNEVSLIDGVVSSFLVNSDTIIVDNFCEMAFMLQCQSLFSTHSCRLVITFKRLPLVSCCSSVSRSPVHSSFIVSSFTTRKKSSLVSFSDFNTVFFESANSAIVTIIVIIFAVVISLFKERESSKTNNSRSSWRGVVPCLPPRKGTNSSIKSFNEK
mmetsp:Transcript_31380/g.38348  ORF Transcript_31380/g.38348 Transcript_31380/m.38348 type:complete len:200 (-) Transcript_31380:1447-2046(-)